MDNPFIVPSDGEADWDSSLNADLHTVDRGYHVTERAGTAINTGQVLWLNSGGFAFPYDPNSTTAYPHAMAYTAAASGDSLTALAWGIVRSLGINSPAIPGFGLYVSALTPGLIVTSPFGHKIGRGLTGRGVLFNPAIAPQRLTALLDVDASALADGRIPKWSNASSKFVMAVDSGGGGGGGGSFGSLTDVDTTGISDGSIPKWSNTTSKWEMAVDSGGGGGGSDGSPPTVVQFAWSGSLDSVTFASAPTSGNMLVAMIWNTVGDTAGIGWTRLADNSSGLDYKTIMSKIMGSGETMTQTPLGVHGNGGGVAVWELAAPTGHIVNVLAAQVGGESSNNSNISVLLPNMTDVLGLAATAWTTTISAAYNQGTSDVFNNTGNRKIAAGHIKPSQGAQAGVLAIGVAGGNNKASTALVVVV